MDFSNLCKHCYGFIQSTLHTLINYMWLTAISSVTVSLHYLPRCLCSTVTCRLPFNDFKWFQITQKKKTVVQRKSRKVLLRTKTYACGYLHWNGNRNTDLSILLPRARKCGIVKLFLVAFFKKHVLAECQRPGSLWSARRGREIIRLGSNKTLFSIRLDQWFPTGEEFLPREDFHEIRGGISTLYFSSLTII